VEDYHYAQQAATYQIAFSSTFDPDDENFSLAQPPPPKVTKLFSGTARADWEQLLRDMPPQERSNWLQQQKRHNRQKDHDAGIDPSYATTLSSSASSNTDDDMSTPSSTAAAITSTDEWVFEVRTTVLVETTRGTVQLPVRASSRRENSHGLPDVIYFDQDDKNDSTTGQDGVGTEQQRQRQRGSGTSSDRSSRSASPQPSEQEKGSINNKKTRGVLWLDTDLAPAESRGENDDDDEEGHMSSDDDEISENTSRDCYNLFMTNPELTGNLKIAEVFVSRPDLMSLQVQGQLRAPSFSVRQWWNAPQTRGSNDTSSSSSQELGPLVLGPGEQRYVVTVCTAGSSSTTTSDPNSWFYGTDNDGFESIDEIVLASDSSQSALETRAAKAAARAARFASSAKYSLGFLGIKTDSGLSLLVALERLRKDCSASKSNAAQASPSSAPSEQLRRQQVYPPTYHHALYKVQDLPIEELAAKKGKQSAVAAPSTPLVASALKSEPGRLDFSLLSSSSPTVVSYLGIRNPKDYPIKIMRSGVAVEIEDEVDPNQPNPEELGLHMSVKIQNSYLEAEDLTEEALRVTCSIRWDRFQAHNLESLFFHGNVILRATAHVDYNYHQWIRNLVNTNSKRQQGKILISNDYADEPETSEITKQTEFVLEIPLTVSMVQGKVGIMIHRTSHPFPHLWAVQSWKEGLGSVSSIFYPQRAFDIRAELDSGDGPLTEPIFGPSGIDHKLRIFANINIPSRVGNRDEYQPQSLQLATAKIAEDKGNATSGNEDHLDDVCKRFNVTIGEPPDGAFPFEGFNDVGLVHIKYRFANSDSGGSDDDADSDIEYSSVPAFPKYCYLALTTDPFTELHQIPLVVYPGQTDISSTQSPSRTGFHHNKQRRGKFKKKNQRKRSDEGRESEDSLEPEDGAEADSHAVVGFEGLLQWFQKSSVGSSLKSLLEQRYGENREWGWNRRGYQNDDKLLAQYVSSLCRKSVNLRTAQLRPILLKVGAIRHGTVETASFYMTNHNPIPLLVSVDVGEVEGMSISLARVPTRGQGDGHNILDHFPKKRNVVSNALGGPYQHLVPNGEYQGHPLEGLRKFLRTTDVAQQFLSLFRFRDAISLSHAAVDRQPLLNTLYKKYAFGEFHRDPLPIRFGQDGWSKCRRRISPSRSFIDPGYEFNLTDSCDTCDTESGTDGDDNDEEYVMDQTVATGKGPLMISDDSRISRQLKVCWDKDAEPLDYPSDGTYTIVPPGAVARFDLKVHSPPKTMLRDDITRFLSTGLVLSTDHNEILPVFVTFEALLGELELSASEGADSHKHSAKLNCSRSSQLLNKANDSAKGDVSSIEVSPNLFYDPVDAVKLANAPLTNRSNSNNLDVALHVKSTFSRDIRLVKVTSCNPWFQVHLNEENDTLPLLPSYRGAGSHLGVDIGSVKSTISCQSRRHPIATLDYPSFYQCALNWLARRSELQPRGCGVSPAQKKRKNPNEDGPQPVQVAEHGGVKRAAKALEKALLVSSYAFRSSGGDTSAADAENAKYPLRFHARGDGLLAPLVLDVFADVWDSWRVVADYGLRKLSSTLQATIEYDTGVRSRLDVSKLQNLSVTMRDTIVESTLSTPKLFECQRAIEINDIAHAVTGDDESPSTISFNPTMVADVSSVIIPLKNPSSVPVRVRLATAMRTLGGEVGASKTSGESPLMSKFGIREEVRDAFTESSSPPFVQRGKLNTTTQHFHAGVSAEQLWWDGAGGYFLADDYGDLIRSHHNVRITAGAGAVVSLVNPSLHSNVAILVGCGTACGLREDQKPHMDSNETLQLASPFGAAAAAGITLYGRMRSSLPHVNLRSTDEPLYVAGDDNPAGKHGGPSAFAIPYSALDDVIIPPFGEVELGPIFFRPPGRYSVHGCQTEADNRIISVSGNGEKAKACSSDVYQSMVYLENSLTGLERISLRGKATWERIVFLDPPPAQALFGDDFGDLEQRLGRPSLIFSGSRAGQASHFDRRPELESSFPGSSIKEFLVHNEGDTVVDINNIYFSDSARLHTKYSSSETLGKDNDVCAYKQFRLLNCLGDKDLEMDERGVRNVERGFRLEPGESISLFIEHFPDCSTPRDYIALNFEHRRRGTLSSTSGKINSLSPSHLKQSSAFRKRKVELLIGYDMSTEEFKACQPVRRWGYSTRHLHREAQCASNKRCRKSWFSRFNHRLFILGWIVIKFLFMTFALTTAYMIIFKGYFFRQLANDLFSSALGPRRKASEKAIEKDSGEKPSTTQPTIVRGNWAAAFRCLARADPTSSDLQALGREQIRHVVLGRYNNMGTLPPQCFNSNGVFNRERGVVVTSGSPGRQVTGKEGASGNDRTRTISDGLYKKFSSHQDGHLQRSLPCGLSWRVAVSRGMKLPKLTGGFLLAPELQLQRDERAKLVADSLDEQSTEESDEGSEEGSEEPDDASEAQESDDGDESQLQESFVSELSEEQMPGTPDDVSEEKVIPETETRKVEASTEVAEKEKVDETKKEVDIAVKEPVKSAPKETAPLPPPPPEATAAPEKGVEDKEAKDIANGSTEKTETRSRSRGAARAKSPLGGTTVATNSRKKESEPVSSARKKKDKSQEPKRDRRGRQRASAPAAAKTESEENSAAGKSIPKGSQKKELRNKPNDSKTLSRPAKGKASADKGDEGGKAERGDKVDKNDKAKQPVGGKAGHREKKATGTKSEPRTRLRGESEEKSIKRKAKKGETPVSAKKSSKDVSDSAPNDKKSKTAPGKKGKKGRPDKGASAQAKTGDKPPKAQPESAATAPEPALRPPPGLAPPPGFGGQGNSGTQLNTIPRSSFDTSLLTPAAFLSDTSILGSPSSTVIGTPSRPIGDASFGGLSPSILTASGVPTLPSSSRDVAGEALLASVTSTPMNRGLESSVHNSDSAAGFDVMDFLDSILNDGNSVPQPPTSQPPLPPNDNQNPFVSGNPTPLPPLSSDPWATERQSRASAYGIAIDDAHTPSVDPSVDGLNPPSTISSLDGGEPIASIPLLNTASILYATDSVRDDDDEDDENDDSFYASLLGKAVVEDDDNNSSQ